MTNNSTPFRLSALSSQHLQVDTKTGYSNYTREGDFPYEEKGISLQQENYLHMQGKVWGEESYTRNQENFTCEQGAMRPAKLREFSRQFAQLLQG